MTHGRRRFLRARHARRRHGRVVGRPRPARDSSRTAVRETVEKEESRSRCHDTWYMWALDDRPRSAARSADSAGSWYAVRYDTSRTFGEAVSDGPDLQGWSCVGHLDAPETVRMSNYPHRGSFRSPHRFDHAATGPSRADASGQVPHRGRRNGSRRIDCDPAGLAPAGSRRRRASPRKLRAETGIVRVYPSCWRYLAISMQEGQRSPPGPGATSWPWQWGFLPRRAAIVRTTHSLAAILASGTNRKWDELPRPSPTEPGRHPSRGAPSYHPL